MCGVAYIPLAQQEVFSDVATRPNETATPPHQPAGDHEPAMQCLESRQHIHWWRGLQEED